MKIGIIGAGSMGGTLARHLAKLGHQVSIANSRGPESLTALAAEIDATPVTIREVAKSGEIVILALPTKAVADLPRDLFAGVPSVVVIDVGNYHPELRDGRIDAIDRGMLDSQWVAEQIGHPVIKAFNNIFAQSLLEKSAPPGTKGRIALSVCGNSSDAKAVVLRLIDDLGFDPVDGGALDDSWRQQPGTPAYCRDLEAAALRRALAEADRSRIAEYRAEQEALIRRSMEQNERERSSDMAAKKDFTTTLMVDNTPKEVFDAINNVRGWWSGENVGRTDRLGEFQHRHGDMHRCTIKITELVPGRMVHWRVVDNYFDFVKDKSEWKDTDIVFEIVKKKDKTEVRFTHVGLVPSYECYDICSDAWGRLINGSLRDLITKGKGQPE
jgi:hypothetical protein